MARHLAFRSGSPGVVMIATAALLVLMMAPFASQAQGLGVCDAYQQLLNQTHFDRTPFCGRPDYGPVSGFTQLKRHYWGVEQIWPIFTHVYEFMLFDNQFHVQRWFAPNPNDPGKPLVTTNPDTKDDIAKTLRLHWMRVWSYEKPIDIQNDGSPLNVLIWQGYGATRGAQVCGAVYYGHPWTNPYVHQQAFIINPDAAAIDERLTRRIFGAPGESSSARLSRKPSNSPFLPPGATPFEPLADSIGVFEYRGRYYIETENRPKTKDAPLPPVVVYLREHNHTTRLCSIHLKNMPVPVD
jgi:hypothetical protein